jgi:hypothetical protein
VTCFNCGLPERTLSQDGKSIQIQLAVGYGEKRPRKSTVWVCSDFCAIQALGISKHGAKTSSWPITLAQWTPIAKRILRDLK